MRLLKPLTLVLVLLAALAPTALAAGKGPKHHQSKPKQAKSVTRLDPNYGTNGIAATATAEAEKPVRMALAPNGRSYVLQGKWLIAFQSSGQVATGFGTDGKVFVAPDKGEGAPSGLTIDSQGRILVSGMTGLGRNNEVASPPSEARKESAPLQEAYVVRYLANGTRDGSFGNGGEVDTNFGLPPLRGTFTNPEAEYESPQFEATSIAVDSEDRPLIGGSYNTTEPCGVRRGSTVSFVARLTASGALDTSFAGKGFATGPEDQVKALAETPGGGSVALSGILPTICEEHDSRRLRSFDAFTETGEQSPLLDPARPQFYSAATPAVDQQGRLLVAEEPEEFGGGGQEALMRLLPSGAVDTSFGHEGGYPLTGRIETAPAAVTVDAKERPIVAGTGPAIELMRFTPAGKADSTFGPKGVFTKRFGGGNTGKVGAVAVDSKGRIYVAESVFSPQGYGVWVVRVLPAS